MRVVLTDRFTRSFTDAPPDIQERFGQQLAHLLRDLRHPSLRAKKYDEANDVWQARVTDSWRFYFRIDGDTYQVLDLIPHPK